ncbi:enoyl-CoA hydratase/isomerase family protein [Tsukamurella sputi]|uniref:Enoyl-CoA hydratase/isomerase family protein n=1 Tax=Tsukamurella sputi TaxID=2591848 RepID=A0A5C5RP71_9ACTN|nr:enoyl-CoA hydratase/isomerase family protein [Tsukamurella sputi]TWS24293.1 enoyl-CoA hydratase/isomerase family protein [Tsukamurella sputi]
MTDTAGTVEVTSVEGVATVILRRERKRNALSLHMESELLAALHSPEVEKADVIVVTGGPAVFSAGADVTELREMNPRAIADYYRASGAVYEVFANLRQPTVAAIAGYCLGGGLELSLAADIRVASEDAVFGFPETSIGILPSSGGVTRFGRVVGAGRARDLILRGRRFGTVEAERMGLVTEVTAPGEAVDGALRVARELSGFSSLALQYTKQALDVAADAPQHAALVVERLAYAALSVADDQPGDRADQRLRPHER